MNKVFPPLPWILEFYWYYSTLTITLTWLIAPLLFYVILTQSKNLRTFKWLILNHSFWCFLVTSGIGLLKPLIFLPAFAGYPLGFLRQNGSFVATGSMAIIGIVACVNCVVGLAATTFSRYLLAFPSKLTNWFSFKFAFAFIAILTAFSYLIYFFQFLPFVSNNLDSIKQEAIKYDSFLATIISEHGFFYAPRKYGNKMMLSVFISCVAIILLSLIVMLIFIYLVTKFRKSQTTTGLQRSLIISTIMQILLTILFLFSPVTVIAATITFEIPNSTNLSCLIFSLLSTHSLFEFCATLFFVSPYRKFVSKLFTKILGSNRNNPSRVIQISASVSVTDAAKGNYQRRSTMP